MPIGFIGLGMMGAGMASNLQKAGHKLVVHDLKRQAASHHLAAGADWADSPRAVAAACDVVFTSLPAPPDVEAVGFGENGLVHGFRKGSVWFDLSTNSVSLVRHEPSGMFIATMTASRQGTGTGIYASLSRDLIAWSEPVLVRAVPIFQGVTCNDTFSVGYPALLDPASTTRNFETIGAQGWLFMTRYNLHICRVGSDRDLVRVPVTIAAR